MDVRKRHNCTGFLRILIQGTRTNPELFLPLQNSSVAARNVELLLGQTLRRVPVEVRQFRHRNCTAVVSVPASAPSHVSFVQHPVAQQIALPSSADTGY